MVTGTSVGEADNHQPMRRNVFTIEPADGQPMGSPVCFEEDGFMLRVDDPTGTGTL